MAEEVRIKFSDLKNDHPLTLDDSDLIAIAHVDQNSETGYTSMTTMPSQLATKINEGTTFSNLQTTSKYIVSAINEVRGTWLTGTLTAGATSITLSDASITTSSMIDIYTDADIDYTAITVATGSVTITFDAQQADLGVKVRVF